MRSMRSLRHQKVLCIERNKAAQIYEQRIQERDMGTYTHGQTAYVNTNTTEQNLLKYTRIHTETRATH